MRNFFKFSTSKPSFWGCLPFKSCPKTGDIYTNPSEIGNLKSPQRRKKTEQFRRYLNRSVCLAFAFIIDAGTFLSILPDSVCLFALFNQLSSHFDSLIPSNSMEFELCGCNYNLLNDPTWSASLRGVSGSVITIIHCFFISVNYNSDIFLNSSRFNSFLNSSSVGI